MYKWQERRIVRSILFVILLILALIYVWWTRPSRTRKKPPRPAALETVAQQLTWKAELLIDSGYLPALFDEITRAKESIDISMFVIRADPASPVTREIIASLSEAAKAGVKIRVLVDRPDDINLSHFRFNLEAGTMLALGGAEVRFDNPLSELHEKLIVFDKRRIIVGAHNWTDDALVRNREVSVLCEASEPINSVVTDFEARWNDAVPISKTSGPGEFMTVGDELEGEGGE